MSTRRGVIGGKVETGGHTAIIKGALPLIEHQRKQLLIGKIRSQRISGRHGHSQTCLVAKKVPVGLQICVKTRSESQIFLITGQPEAVTKILQEFCRKQQWRWLFREVS